jgi:cold shock CspA family protein/uncharacterized LabA/DUF88 family protein
VFSAIGSPTVSPAKSSLERLVKIAIFYDGNFFYHVSNFYKYVHQLRKRISIPGLHEFIRHHVARLEMTDPQYCQIVDAHFFRGRLSAREADARQKLFVERAFDDILMAEGVVTHYLPIRHNTEKGIDVWLALEAFELSLYKRFNALVLIAGDADFVPLARKLNSLGTRVMVLGWNIKFTDDLGQERETTTSVKLLDEVTYPVMMDEIIDEGVRTSDPLIRYLFVDARPPVESEVSSRRASTEASPPQQSIQSSVSGDGAVSSNPRAESGSQAESGAQSESGAHFGAGLEAKAPEEDQAPNGAEEMMEGEVMSVHQGFGFIRCSSFANNVFFHWTSLTNREFSDIQKGQRVRFTASESGRGPVAKVLEIIG